MPLSWQPGTTPKGRPILRVEMSGVVTPEEAQRLVDVSSVGGAFHNIARVSVIHRDVVYATDTQKVFLQAKSYEIPVAVVAVKDSPQWKALSLLVNVARLSTKATRGSDHYDVDFFETEAAAMAWIDTQP